MKNDLIFVMLASFLSVLIIVTLGVIWYDDIFPSPKGTVELPGTLYVLKDEKNKVTCWTLSKASDAGISCWPTGFFSEETEE